MRQQQLMIQKIDAFDEIEGLTNSMQKLRVFTDEKKWYDNMITYNISSRNAIIIYNY